MAKASKRHNSEYRNFFYALIIAKNIYSIKYIKKNRRAGKQLEKVLKSSADRVILRPCLVERMGNYSRNTATSVRQLGAIAQRLEWVETCIRKGKRKGNNMTVNTNDVLVDYEGLCCQLTDTLLVLEMASMEDSKQSSALLNTVIQAMNQLISEHTQQANDYRKGIKHE